MYYKYNLYHQAKKLISTRVYISQHYGKLNCILECKMFQNKVTFFKISHYHYLKQENFKSYLLKTRAYLKKFLHNLHW